jgi:hypothetical protein
MLYIEVGATNVGIYKVNIQISFIVLLGMQFS